MLEGLYDRQGKLSLTSTFNKKNLQLNFFAKAKSMIFIPLRWLHVVHSSKKSLGVCGSVVSPTSACIKYLRDGIDWFVSMYQKDALESFKDVKTQNWKYFWLSHIYH